MQVNSDQEAYPNACDECDKSVCECAPAAEPTDDDKIWPIVRMYFKIGGYFKISWREFRETPWPVLKQLATILDEREADMDQFIGYEEASIFKNLRRMFPPNKD